ncbi:MAG: hypothetical protein M4D85_03555 [Actinomycetota bacterium]|nr:hypothetical protein [Actinomycetota bacterium]
MKFEFTALPEGAMVFPLWLDDLPVVQLRRESHHLLFTVRLMNDENEPVLVIEDNALVMSTEPWDITFTGQTVTIRTAHRAVFVTLTVDPSGSVTLGRGRLLHNGIECELWDDALYTINDRNSFGPMTFRDAIFGLALGNPPQLPPPHFFATVFEGIPRYPDNLTDNRAIMARRRRQARKGDAAS